MIGIEIRIEMFFANQLNKKSLDAPRVTKGDFLILGKSNCIKPISHLGSLRLFFLGVKRWAIGGAAFL